MAKKVVKSPELPDPKEERRRVIDARVQALITDISDLRSERNALAPISRLPPELLARILHFCSLREVVPYDPMLGGVVHELGGYHLSVSWIRVTHICRHWRAVALQSPSLWANINFSWPKWTVEMLRRSKQAPIHIKADLTIITPNAISTVQLALDHAHRAKEIDLQAPKHVLEKLGGGLTSSSPSLETLKLSSSRFNNYLVDSTCTLPDNLFNGETPNLRRLHLYNCDLKWDSPLLAGLTHLQLHRSSGRPDCRPTASQMLSVLKNMPALQCLALHYASPSSLAPEALVNPERAGLHFLQKLTIQDQLSYACNLISSIDVPDRLAANLEVVASTNDDNDFSRLYPFISAQTDAGGTDGEGDLSTKHALHTFRIVGAEEKSIHLQGWTGQEPMASRDPLIPYIELHGVQLETTPSIELSLSWQSWEVDRAANVVKNVCKHMHLDQLESICLSNLEYVPKEVWYEVLGESKSIKTVKLRGEAATGFIDAIVDAGRDTEGADTTVAFMPVLRTVLLEEVNFAESVRGSPLFDVLKHMLHHRRADPSMHAIEQLVINRSRAITDEKIAMLKEEVPTVTWDSVNWSYADDDSSDEDLDDNYDDDHWGYGGLWLDPYADSEFDEEEYDELPWGF